MYKNIKKKKISKKTKETSDTIDTQKQNKKHNRNCCTMFINKEDRDAQRKQLSIYK